MTLFLRDKNNRSIVEIELWVTGEAGREYVELSSSIYIKEYSLLLLKTKEDARISLISDFDILSELRGWLWERFFAGKKNTAKEFDNVLSAVRKILDDIGSRYELYRVED